MITYQTEPWSIIEDDVARMAEDHYKECRAAENEFPFELDTDLYRIMDEQDMLHCMTARDDGQLVGYLVNAISPHHMQFRAKTANHMGWYVAPAYRNKMVGIRLLKLADEPLKKMGVQIMYGSHTIHTDASPIFKRLGWSDLEKSYVKVVR